MKKEELRNIINRVPLKNVTCNICGDHKYSCSFDLFFNGTSYDVFTVGDYGEITYYAKNVDEDTACKILLSEYKDFISSMYSYSITDNYYPQVKKELTGDNQEQLKLIRESEFLDVIKLKASFLSDGDLNVVFNEIPYYNNFGHIKVFRKNTLIWDGADSVFSKWHINSFIVSSKFNIILLLRGSAGGHYPVKPVVVDLKSGEIVELSAPNDCGFGDFTLLYSSNIAYFCSHYPCICTFYDIENKVELYSFNNLENFKFENLQSAIYTWSVCPVPDCILILTLEFRDNLVLYNVRKREVVQTATFPVKEDKRYSFGMYFDKEKQRVIVKSFCPTEPLGSDVQCYSVYFDDFLK